MNTNDLRSEVKRRLGPRRFNHTLGCEAEAVSLSEHYGCDVELARAAALLHDITKELKPHEHLELCKKWNIRMDPITFATPVLYHAFTGAYVAKKEFNMGGEVFDAVRYHTTARAGMSLLSKIIYCADFTEVGRPFNSTRILRERSYKDLDAVVLYGLIQSIGEVTQKNRLLHGDTIAAYNELVAGSEASIKENPILK